MREKTKTIAEQLSAMVPKSLDDVIRKNRDKAGLRFSTEEDLAQIASQMPPGSKRAVPVSKWNLVTVWEHHAPPFVTLFGRNDDRNRTWSTSPVLQLDSQAKLLVTQSGTLYRLAGEQGTEEDLDLLHVCVWLRQSGAGDYFGIPAFFY